MESSFKVDNLRGSALIFIILFTFMFILISMSLEVLCTKLLAKTIS